MDAFHISDAQAEDVAAIASIYRHYVLTSAATMEIEPPDEAEMQRRLEDVKSRGLPFLVGRVEGEIVGYGYATPFRPRPGYRYTVEDSVYLHPAYAGQGYGRQILGALIFVCRSWGAKQMIAVIGGDNPASEVMHRGLGFVNVGVLRDAGWKFDRPQKITMMQLEL